MRAHGRRPHRQTWPAATVVALFAIPFLPVLAAAQWKPHTVRQLNGRAGGIKQGAKSQILTESWNRVVAVPYLVYMPEKDRLLMLVSCDYPHQAMVLASNDRGATWSTPKYVHTDSAGKPDTGMGVSLTYLGDGKALLAAGNAIWFSSDYGDTWEKRSANPKAASGLTFNFWDPFFVDKDSQTGAIKRVLAGGYTMDMALYESTSMPGYSTGGIEVSTDEGRTWAGFQEPEWSGVNEIAFVRAKNRDLVAACRTDWPKRFRKANLDHYEGLAVSISKDNGETWSKLNRLYAWGRHHPSLVVLPNGDILMSYVVRKGYPETAEGYPQFGIEAVVSQDHGQTWDLDHRYILVVWPGIRTGPNAWYASSQATSTVLLPNGELLTAFGTGYRSLDPTGKGRPGPRDVGLVLWNLNRGPVNADRTIANSLFDSDLRDKFDPNPGKHRIKAICPAAPGKENIAVRTEGSEVRASPNDGEPAYILKDPYSRPVLTLQTIPAWVELRWPKEHRIDEIHIQPGAPEQARRPSTECVPLDYRLQYLKGSEWVDLASPITNARRYRDFDKQLRAYLVQDQEFEYIDKFPPVEAKALRIYITRSSDSGKRTKSPDEPVLSESKRETALRMIEVFEAKLK